MPNYSIKDVAAYAHVSKSTVSRVITQKGYVSEEKRKMVEKAIKELGYRPNSIARSLVSSQSKTIGVCLPFLNTPFFAGLMGGIETAADKLGYDVIIYHTRENIKAERNAIIRLTERRVDGIIIIPVEGTNEAGLRSCIGELPAVYLMREGKKLRRGNWVVANDYLGSKDAFECLVKKGHRKIGIITGPNDLSTMDNRWRAVEDICKRYDICLDDRLIKCSKLNFDCAHDAAKSLLNEPDQPTAVYTIHYWGCAGFMREAQKRHISIPADISLSSFEAFDDWNVILPVKIASNIYPAAEMGSTAVRLLNDYLEEPGKNSSKRVELNPVFQEGDSVLDIG